MEDYIKFRDTVGDFFSLQNFLIEDGYLREGGTNHIFCPFHNDEADRSATYFPEDDLLWCYKDKRQYSSYDYLSEIKGLTDDEIKDQLPESVTFEENESNGDQNLEGLKESINDIKYKFSNGEISIEEASSLIVKVLS